MVGIEKEDVILDLRKEIDRIDGEIFDLLKRRFEISKKIGRVKAGNGLDIEDIEREKAMIEKRIEESGLSEDFVEKLFELIFEESKRLQKV